MKKMMLGLLAVSLSTAAFADVRQEMCAPFCSFANWYGQGFAGVNFIGNYDKEDTKIDLDIGYLAGASVGYRFTRYFRVEAEGAYRFNDFGYLTINKTKYAAKGHRDTITAMGNAYFEVPIGSSGVAAYIGGGVGERWNRQNLGLKPLKIEDTTIVNLPSKSIDRGHDVAFQGILGVTCCSYKQAQLGIEYRYLDGPNMEANNSLDVNVKYYF